MDISLEQIKLPDLDCFKKYCIRVFSHVRPSSTFLSIKNYQNNFGEQSDFAVCFHIDYLASVKRSIIIVDNFKPKKSDVKNKAFALQDLRAARKNILQSFALTLSGANPFYTCEGVYESIMDADNKPIPGIKLHPGQNAVHINALKFRKKIIKRGIYPAVNSAPETLARRFIMEKTPLANWVQFKLVPGRFDKLTVQKMTIKGR